MDKQTSEKLNDTLEKMGAMNDGQPSNSASTSDSGQSSDMSFYVIMLAMIVGMGFYVSYDMEQRYGSSDSSAPVAEQPANDPALEPVVVSVEKTKVVEVKPLAEIPATESTPEAVVVEKIEQKTTVTTAVVPVENAEPVVEAAPAPAETNTEQTVEKVEESVAVQEPAPVVVQETAPTPVSSLMMPAMEAAQQAADVVAAPVVQAIETAAETTDTVTAPVIQPVQAAAQSYNPYGYQYGQPQNNYYQQQPQYSNPYQYGNPYGNQYGNPYGNQYSNPYGYGNNPYQQPAAQPAQ